jgi:hypothetical protein
MADTALLALALALLAGLLVAEKQTRTGPTLVFKTPLSALFVAVALIQPHPIQSYYHWVLAGLVWGLIGDVCLRKWVRSALDSSLKRDASKGSGISAKSRT